MALFSYVKISKEVTPVENLSEKVQEHDNLIKEQDKRIRDLEVNEAVTESKLDTTNSLLKAIAVMIGGGIVTLISNILYHSIKF